MWRKREEVAGRRERGVEVYARACVVPHAPPHTADAGVAKEKARAKQKAYTYKEARGRRKNSRRGVAKGLHRNRRRQAQKKS